MPRIPRLPETPSPESLAFGATVLNAPAAEPGAVESLFAEAGIAGVEVAHEDREQLIESAEDWWTIAMGTGFRGTIDRLTSEERHRVRAECVAWPRHRCKCR